MSAGSSTELERRGRIPLMNLAAASGVICLAGGAFVLSFSALRDLAIASGIPGQLAFLWPLIVDGFIVVATASAFALSDRGRRVTWYPWAALGAFSVISVAGNALHAQDSDHLSVPVPVATVVSAVPAVALLLASHLLVVMIENSRPRAVSSGVTDPVEAAAPVELVATPVRRWESAGAVTAVTEADVDASPTAPSEVDPAPAEAPAFEEDRPAREVAAAEIRAAMRGGQEPVAQDIADRFQVAVRTARRWIGAERERLNEEGARA